MYKIKHPEVARKTRTTEHPMRNNYNGTEGFLVHYSDSKSWNITGAVGDGVIEKGWVGLLRKLESTISTWSSQYQFLYFFFSDRTSKLLRFGGSFLSLLPFV